MNEQLTQLYGYLHGMWTYRWSALLITWVVAMIGWFVVLSLPDQYASKAVVYIDTSSVMKPLLHGLAPETDARDELVVMSRILLSRDNLLKVIRETDMDLNVKTTDQKEALLEKLGSSIRIKGGVSTGGKKAAKNASNNVYEISYSNTSAELAFHVVSNLLNTMIENALNSSRTDTVTAQKFLDTQIKEYEERLFVAEQKLAEFKKENIGFMPDEKGGYYARLQKGQDMIESLNSKLKLARKRLAELKKQLSGEAPIMDASGSQSATAAKLEAMQAELDQLLASYTEKHPDVIALKASIADLKAREQDGSGGQAGSLDGASEGGGEFNPVYQELKVEANKAQIEVGILQVELEDQKKYVEKLKSYIDVIPEVEAKLTRLNRDYEVTRERYLDLVERRESARLAQSADQSSSDITFRVIEQPIVAHAPSGPPRLLYLVGALIFGLAAGMGWSFLRFMLAPTFIDVRQIAEKTGFPLLGTVSLYLSPEHRKRRRMQLLSFLSATVMLVVVFGGMMVFHQRGVELVNLAMSSMS